MLGLRSGMLACLPEGLWAAASVTVPLALFAGKCLLEWKGGESGDEPPPVPLLKDMFASECRKAKVGALHAVLRCAREAARPRSHCWSSGTGPVLLLCASLTHTSTP